MLAVVCRKSSSNVVATDERVNLRSVIHAVKGLLNPIVADDRLIESEFAAVNVAEGVAACMRFGWAAW